MVTIYVVIVVAYITFTHSWSALPEVKNQIIAKESHDSLSQGQIVI